MKKQTYLYSNGKWNDELNGDLNSKNTLIVCFGSPNIELVEGAINELYTKFNDSVIIGCSTSGEIYQDELYEDSLSVAVMQFQNTDIKLEVSHFENSNKSFDVGANLAKGLVGDKLRSIFVLSDGLNINGSQLTKGINSVLDNKDVIVTGGLAGDGARFEKTWVLVDNKLVSNYITAVGLYGNHINIAYGSQGGWSQFGINRMVTESKDNVLFKLDHKPALEIYKTYLGESAKDLPASGLLYPLMIKEDGSDETKVRTILAINEEDNSITFAGDIPDQSEVMFMRASFDQLIQGAGEAALSKSLQTFNGDGGIAIAVSCVGRKLVLGQKTEDELEAVVEKYADTIDQIGYYSYGEISPLSSGECDLHNQTMTLTLFWES